MLSGIVLAACFACLFIGAFYTQFHFFTAFDFLPSASILFLPAGVKLLAMVVGRWWGILGLFVANDIIEYVFNELPLGFEPYVVRPLVYLLVPYLVLQLLMRQNSIAKDLANLTVYHIVLLAITTSFVGSFVFQWYLYNVSGGHIDLSSAVWSMTVGDVSGIFVSLVLVILLRRLVVHWSGVESAGSEESRQ